MAAPNWSGQKPSSRIAICACMYSPMLFNSFTTSWGEGIASGGGRRASSGVGMRRADGQNEVRLPCS